MISDYLMVAHRGYSALYPENTMISFEKAVEAGCKAIELDVGMTKDGVLVVLHDVTVNRTTNGTGNVHDLTWETVSQLDAGSWKSPEFTGIRIPTFESVLDRFKNENVFLVVEIKYQSAYGLEIIDKIANNILKRRMENQCLIMSFNNQMTSIMKNRYSMLNTGLLGSGDTSQAKILAIGGRHSFISWQYINLDSNIVTEWKNAGLGVNAWTINTETDLQNAYNIGINMFTGNYADKLVRFAEQNSIIQADVSSFSPKKREIKIFNGSEWRKGNVKVYDDNTWENGVLWIL